MKMIKDALIKPLTIIINQMLNTGIFPDKLKIAKISPIHKKRMTHCLQIIDQSHFYLQSPKYLKKLYSNNFRSFSHKINYFTIVNMVLELNT